MSYCSRLLYSHSLVLFCTLGSHAVSQGFLIDTGFRNKKRIGICEALSPLPNNNTCYRMAITKSPGSINIRRHIYSVPLTPSEDEHF